MKTFSQGVNYFDPGLSQMGLFLKKNLATDQENKHSDSLVTVSSLYWEEDLTDHMAMFWGNLPG